MATISNNVLNLSNLTQKNYNSTSLPLWDFNFVAGTTVTSFVVEQQGTSITVSWGDRKQDNATQKTVNLTHVF